MTRSATTFALSLAAAVLATLHVQPTQAQPVLDVFVSTAGTDVNTCGAMVTSPCRTLGFAVGGALPGGGIVFLPPGVHPVTNITQAVNIRNDGVRHLILQDDAFHGSA